MIPLYQITPIQSPKTVETHGRASDVKIIDIVKTVQGIDSHQTTSGDNINNIHSITKP